MGGGAHSPTAAAELPTPSQPQRPAARPCIRRDWAAVRRPGPACHIVVSPSLLSAGGKGIAAWARALARLRCLELS